MGLKNGLLDTHNPKVVGSNPTPATTSKCPVGTFFVSLLLVGFCTLCVRILCMRTYSLVWRFAPIYRPRCLNASIPPPSLIGVEPNPTPATFKKPLVKGFFLTLIKLKTKSDINFDIKFCSKKTFIWLSSFLQPTLLVDNFDFNKKHGYPVFFINFIIFLCPYA